MASELKTPSLRVNWLPCDVTGQVIKHKIGGRMVMMRRLDLEQYY